MAFWTKPPELFADQVAEDHGQLTRLTALNINNKLIQKTPVDTGRARSNWIPSVGVPYFQENGPMDDSSLTWRAINAFEEMHPFEDLYITNSLEYIVPLNNGHSDQAPANFVEMAVASVTDVL